MRLFRRFVPSVQHYDGQKMITKVDGKRFATPLLAVLVIIEVTDVIFAVDSVPAVLAVSREQFIVFASNAWAILGLIASGDDRSDSLERAAEYLTRTQRPDGTWDEPEATGTGFPRVFYLNYHMYRNSFPLLALATFLKTRQQDR